MLSHYISRILFCGIIFDYRQLVCKPRNDTNPRAVIVGPINSFLKPMFYIIIFSTFDVLALIIQAIGGAGASQAEVDGTSTIGPTHIMVCESVYQSYNRKQVFVSKQQATSSLHVSH